MMKIQATIVTLLIGLFGIISCTSKVDNYTLSSPDGKLVLSVEQDSTGVWGYSFTGNGDKLINLSHLGYENEEKGMMPSADWSVSSLETSHDGVWKPVWGKREQVKDQYNELTLSFAATKEESGLDTLKIVFRVYNDGFAFRYEVPATEQQTVLVKQELTQYNFAGDYTSWFYNGEYHNLGPDKLTEVDGKRLPVMTIQAGDNQFMALHEANLIEGEPLVLTSQKGEKLFGISSKPSELKSGSASAWRVVLYGDQPGDLVDSHLIELLNPDPQGDFSWVKPGVAVWDWRINGAITDDGFKYTMTYPSWIRMVDFAAEQGFKYLVLDANWYGPEFESDSDPITGEKAKDVQRLLAYAKDKGVGIWLYLNDVGGRKYPIEKTLKQYGDWGAAGVKYGFMNGTPEEKNQWTKKITQLCAENHLLVDFHDGPVHPYGQMRTWPNAVTREFCHAQLDAHRVFEPKTFVTTVFVNMLAGPLDMNNGMFDLRQGKTTRVDENQPVPSTVVSEAARTLITFSGATILPDIPEMYRKYPELLDFISAEKMPWKESKTLLGEIGKYIVMMRETEDDYLIAAVTNEESRTLSIPLTFLPEGSYKVQLIQDGDDAHYLTNRESYQVEEKQIQSGEEVSVHLAAGGGTCIRIQKR